MTEEKIIDKLQKLQSKAESAATLGNEAEALAFATKVQELLSKHKLNMSVLSIKQQDEEEPMGEDTVQTRGKMKRAGWVVQLADAVAKAYYCGLLIMTHSDAIILVGRKTDRQIAEFVLLRLINFIEAEGKRQHSALRYRLWKENGDMSGAHGFIASFQVAAIRTIRTRLQALRQDEMSSSTDMALVITRSTEEVKARVDELKDPKAKNLSTKLRHGWNAAGNAAGEAAGKKADITGSGLSSGGASKRLQ